MKVSQFLVSPSTCRNGGSPSPLCEASGPVSTWGFDTGNFMANSCGCVTTSSQSIHVGSPDYTAQGAGTGQGIWMSLSANTTVTGTGVLWAVVKGAGSIGGATPG